ncbi:hypothetical protein PQO03_11130 [Lentisphaera profundi]|uniref:DNA polymerase III subunit delta n=1 Tax=Lentisphaera profundi TaxID=1658616 RepID=A0ABY7VQ09_9BACT|nr:hypothetical protein [Lentisphaera profundi]WDE96260.1 hypothetical protein PQO03_11130 [Lentisphaera profundi]
MTYQTFLDDKVSPYILKSLKSNQSGHAWIVSGADVEYLNEFVQGWIEVMICLDRGEDGSPCGVCEACKRHKLGIHNCNTLKPMSLSRSILTDHIRQFISKFGYKPLPWEIKIGIIYEADCMLEQAQNAFLKTLEEPPPQTCFFLVSNKADSLLDTIRSRCRTLNLNRESFSYLNKPWFSELQEILQNLKPANGINSAWIGGSKLNSLMASLRTQAELEIMSDLENEEEDENEKAGDRKKRLELAIKTKMLEERECLINALELWFCDLLKLSQKLSSSACFDIPWAADISWDRALKSFEDFQTLKDNLKAPMGHNEAIINFVSKLCKA